MKKPTEQYVRLPRQLLDSPALDVLTTNEWRALRRILQEHQAKAGFVKDGLIVTARDFRRAGVRPGNVASSLRVLVVLGIIERTRSMGGSATGRTSDMWRPTFLPRDPTKPDDSTHDYMDVKTLDEAKRRAALHRLRDTRDRRAPPKPRKTRKLRVVTALSIAANKISTT
jgi:hypothetical protein